MAAIRIFLTLAFIVFLHNLSAYSQADSSEWITISGKIVSAEEKTSLPSSVIWNKTKNMLNYADENGYFIIKIEKKDTLLFSHIGYKRMIFTTNEKTKYYNIIVELKLQRQYYSVETVEKKGYTYKKFKEIIVNTKLPEKKVPDVQQWLKTNEPALRQDAVFSSHYQPLAGGTGISFSIPTWQDKSREKVKILEQQAEYERIVGQKYNENLVKMATGIESKEEIRKFMVFCSFNQTWLLNSTEYEIIAAVKQKFTEYKKLKFNG